MNYTESSFTHHKCLVNCESCNDARTTWKQLQSTADDREIAINMHLYSLVCLLRYSLRILWAAASAFFVCRSTTFLIPRIFFCAFFYLLSSLSLTRRAVNCRKMLLLRARYTQEYRIRQHILFPFELGNCSSSRSHSLSLLWSVRIDGKNQKCWTETNTQSRSKCSLFDLPTRFHLSHLILFFSLSLSHRRENPGWFGWLSWAQCLDHSSTCQHCTCVDVLLLLLLQPACFFLLFSHTHTRNTKFFALRRFRDCQILYPILTAINDKRYDAAIKPSRLHITVAIKTMILSTTSIFPYDSYSTPGSVFFPTHIQIQHSELRGVQAYKCVHEMGTVYFLVERTRPKNVICTRP